MDRIIDANFNRAKEGLRVCEDVCRFCLNKYRLTKQFKTIRHQLTEIISQLKLKMLIQARNIEQDVGKASNLSELKRKSVSDIFYANVQRVKESIRVLEEFGKLRQGHVARKLKGLRYQVYALEKKVVSQF